MRFYVIVAHDLNRGIGANNTIPWHIPLDMAYFKQLTTTDTLMYSGINRPTESNIVIMGRHTWTSIPKKFRPLPKRVNIVVSRTQSSFEGAHHAASFEAALKLAEKQKAGHIFVIGGGQIYQEAISHPACDTLFVTQLYRSVDCDVVFPDYMSMFRCVYSSNIWVTDQGAVVFKRFAKR